MLGQAVQASKCTTLNAMEQSMPVCILSDCLAEVGGNWTRVVSIWLRDSEHVLSISGILQGEISRPLVPAQQPVNVGSAA